ncbi:helix-turn-helix transcriptional regulator [Promicromonospora iranensis]|uniref:LuxR family maltose regulon positive regulatory protein n=1 Tax=Promicromonospora iranensis TaxID=1105144 RepID=A0ABU2CWE7_9MICO|nr:LuxR C-terminal-related transcriptional regulator [Promicromonospora iranensis]MDR7385618.1 LuxR family maltose regulon positive regulatory protein [Promicromonospora iranensis]
MATSPEPDSLSDSEVRACLASGDLDRIEELFDTLWYDLAARFAPEVLRAVEKIPTGAFDARPRLLHAVLLSYRCLTYRGLSHHRLRRTLQFYVAMGQRYGRRMSSFTRSGDLVSAGAAAVISERMRGEFGEAERIGAWTDAQVTLKREPPAPPWTAVRPAVLPGWLSAERGFTAMLAGSPDQATRLFSRAFAESGEPPHAHYAGANAAANLALLAAYRGHLDLARTWLEALEHLGPLPDWIEHQTALGAEIARILIAIDESDPSTAALLLDRIGPATQLTELWPFVALAGAYYEAHFGDPHKGLRVLDTARQQHGALSPDTTTTTGELVLRAEAKLLLRTGAGTRVLHLAERHAEVESLTLFAAWAHLMAGEDNDAVRLSTEMLQYGDLPVNDRMGHHLVQAAAHLRAQHRNRARASFLAATRLRSTPRHVSPFLSLRDGELDELASLAQVPNPLHSAAAATRRNTPPSAPIVHLTPREREVLHALSARQTAEQAAMQFGVSVTTVRTQIRKIYAKLNVSHRTEAIARAQELGLIRVSQASPHNRAG